MTLCGVQGLNKVTKKKRSALLVISKMLDRLVGEKFLTKKTLRMLTTRPQSLKKTAERQHFTYDMDTSNTQLTP